jgi:hypothetical protein
MAGKADFTSEEWGKILQSIMLAGIAVSLAEPSGLLGMLKEGMASARALLEAQADPSADDLVKAAIADFETFEGLAVAREGVASLVAGSTPAQISEKATDALHQVSSLLDAKAPADSVAFKTWLRHIAESVAEASKEGGLLGFGGVRVSEAEKASLGKISIALNLPTDA